MAKLETKLRDQFATILQENNTVMEQLWQDQQRKLLASQSFQPRVIPAACESREQSAAGSLL